jgi:hypothetical protein
MAAIVMLRTMTAATNAERLISAAQFATCATVRLDAK